MKVSIITVTYNSASTIMDTIESVEKQTYPNIEHILVDGRSTDNTLDMLKEHRPNLATFISEPDEGPYHAMNKGIREATGDVIGILNSDDFFVRDNVVERVVEAFHKHDVNSVYGDLQYVDSAVISKVIRNWRAGRYASNRFLSGWMLPHPTFFVRRDIYERFGLFNSRLTCAADYEMMLRLLYKQNISTYYIPNVLVRMRIGGLSNSSFWNRIVANKEDREAWRINGVHPFLLSTLLKPVRKISQYVPL